MERTLELLQQGLAEYGLDESKAPQLIHFAKLLLETNQVMNLTAITEPEAVAQLHLLDSAALASLIPLEGKTVVDVGTGAGFPGMPLQILVPEARFTLLDSLGKRIRFLESCCQTLSLPQARCVQARAEEYAREHRERFDYAVSRAVAALPVLCELALPMVRVGGAFLAMKSVDSDEEIRQAKSAMAQLGGCLEAVRDYTIPGTQVQHRLVVIRKNSPTPHQFPRAFAKIKKSPLL